MKEFDAFLCHSSEDKRYFVRPLAQKIIEYGAKIWYDEFSLSVGSSLSRSIEKGLTNSNFGLVILSKSFFKKKWTEYELRALNSIELDNPNTIIPLWYKVGIDAVKNFSPYLADKRAIICEKKPIEKIAEEILEVIRKDLFEEILRKKAWRKFIHGAKIEKMSGEQFEDLKEGPIRHENLPIDLITRIRLIRAALFDVDPHSMEYWLDGFMRDLHPENEVHNWETIISCYLESVQTLKVRSTAKKLEIYRCALGLISGYTKEDLKASNLSHLTNNELSNIIVICKFPIPVFDINENFTKNVRN